MLGPSWQGLLRACLHRFFKLAFAPAALRCPEFPRLRTSRRITAHFVCPDAVCWLLGRDPTRFSSSCRSLICQLDDNCNLSTTVCARRRFLRECGCICCEDELDRRRSPFMVSLVVIWNPRMHNQNDVNTLTGRSQPAFEAVMGPTSLGRADWPRRALDGSVTGS
jgi:hypothetical protein